MFSLFRKQLIQVFLFIGLQIVIFLHFTTLNVVGDKCYEFFQLIIWQLLNALLKLRRLRFEDMCILQF